jgi:amino acid adenylation domain-containing protein
MEAEDSLRFRTAAIDHPLLGQRVNAPVPIWENRLDRLGLQYLHDHRVQGQGLLAGAVYLELALAAARRQFGGDPVVLEEVEFVKPCILQSDGRTCLQTILEPDESTFRIYSRSADNDQPWTCHATGRARLEQTLDAGRGFDHKQVRDRCITEIPPAECYRRMLDHGLQYGPSFQAVDRLWSGPGEALGLIRWPASFEHGPTDYEIHPSLLDACLQVLSGALPDRSGTYLPRGVRQLRCYGPTQGPLWSHVRVLEDNGNRASANIQVFDQAGNLKVELRGFRLQLLDPSADERSSEDASGLAYEYRWQLKRRSNQRVAVVATDLAGPLHIGNAIRDQAARLQGDLELVSREQQFEAAVNPLCSSFLADALRQLGVCFQPPERVSPELLVDRFGVAASSRRFLERGFELMEQHGLLRRVGGEWEVVGLPIEEPQVVWREMLTRMPTFHPDLMMVGRCAQGLVGILRGNVDPLETLFPEGSLTLAEHFYQDSLKTRALSSAGQLAVAELVRNLRPGRTLRVLELGAGTGGFTAYVLPELPADRTEYFFTDISPHFFQRARAGKFRDYGFVEYQRLDIEADPSAQGFEPHSFDVIIGFGVLHAAADLRIALAHVKQLLGSGGILVIGETVWPKPWMDFIFGLTEGWHRHTDHDLRPTHSLLSLEGWRSLLAQEGFSDIVEATGAALSLGYALMMSRGPRLEAVPPAASSSAAENSGRWLIVADAGGIGAELAGQLRARGQDCEIVAAGAELRVACQELTPTDSAPWRGIVHLRNCDVTSPESASDSLSAALADGCLSTASLAQALDKYEVDRAPRLWVVTRGAQSPFSTAEPPAIAQSPVWGLCRVIGNESPKLRPTLIDLSAQATAEEISSLCAELLLGDQEEEICLRGDQRFVARIEPFNDGAHAEIRHLKGQTDDPSCQLEIERPGTLDNLMLRETSRRRPGPGEIEIRVVAAGVNFKDVMKALGLVGWLSVDINGECAGVITAIGPGVEGWHVGDEVVALAKRSAGSFVTTPADYVARKPPRLSFEEAATWPIVFATSHLALNYHGRMRTGERVLIHSASGGVGLAAIQLAQRAGAEIFATAGTAEKREFLRALGIRHVMDSRSLVFAEQVLDATDGQGVDLVLNSLPGEAIAKGLSVLRDYGRFLEIGKRDIDQNHRLGLRPFSKQLSFFAVDMAAILDARTELASSLLQELSAWFWDGSLEALPFRVFPISRAVEAFRYMSQSRHIGKIVLSLRPQKVACWRARSSSAPAFHRDATYLITGGCGGFGLAVAQWMVAQGAGHLVLLGRSGASSAAAKDAVEKMRQAGAEVIVAQTDVADEEQLARLFAEITAKLPPLRGVFHAAMVIKDCLVGQLDVESLREVWRPKVHGAWNLHRLTAGMELDYFVLFSSVASVVGPGGQASYASANAFLDALARYRRAVGMPAVSIGWGALEEVGWVARNREVRERLFVYGLGSFTVAEALEVLSRALRRRPHDPVVTRFDPQRAAASFGRLARFSTLFAATVEHQVALHKSGVRATLLAAEDGARRDLLTSLLRERVARALGTAPDKVDPDKALTQLGLDSLMGIELRNWVEDELKLSLSMLDLLGGLSVERLAELLDQQLPHVGEAAATRPETEAEPLLNRPDDAVVPHEWVDQPLSFGQERLWFLDRLEPGNPAYVERIGLRIRERVDPDVMQRVLDEMCRRHESLRTTFHLVEGRPIQRIAQDATIVVRTVNLGSLSGEEADAQLRRHIIDESQDPFDLAQGPLLRVTLLRFGENDTVWLTSAHHILIDATSRRVMLRELRQLYEAFVAGQPSPLPEPRARYADFVRWQRSELAGPRLEQLLNFWRKRLHGPPPPIELPTDRARPAQFSYRGADLQFELGEDLVSDLQALGRTRTVTPFMILLAAFNALLYRYTGQEDFVVASPITGRERVEFEDLIGFFVNTLVLRSDLSGDPTFEQLLDRTREVALEAYDQRALPFEQILQLFPERELSRVPLAQVAFTFEPPEIAEAGLGIDLIAVPSIAAKFDLMLLIRARQGRMYCTFEYCTDLFDASTIRRMADHFIAVLAGAVRCPTLRVSCLPLASETEQRQVMVSGTGPRIDYPEPAAIHRIFESQASLRPDAVALIGEDQVMTYGELNAAANRWGRYLRSLGVGSGVSVGLIGERRCRMVVATLAVLKAGGVCVPLDPTTPQERLAFYLENARVGIVLSDRSLGERLASSPVKVVLVDVEPDAVLELASDNLPNPVGAEDLAYVFFTSGSTGTPKGVEVMHRGIVRLCMDDQVHLGPQQVHLQLSAPTFDVSLFELWGALLRGGRCVLFPGPPLTSVQRLGETISSFGITTLQLTPTLFNTVIDQCPEVLEPVQQLLIGGEALSVSHVRRALEVLPGLRMINAYGPTEGSVWTTYGLIDQAAAASCRSIPIGRPLANTQVHVLDRHLNLTAIGVPGELYVGGDALARGYLGRPDLTTERFIANPFGAGRLYRTGDLARWLPDDRIEFLGRIDRQLKLRGHRIEPGEIETAILKHPGFHQAAVAMRQDDGAGPHLVAYVAGSQPPSDAELRQFVGQSLPDYMIPVRFVFMNQLPLTTSGKVDYGSLPAPERSRGSTETVAPRSQLEREIAQVWQQLLRLDRIGIHDNFFDLGGHSMMVVEAHYQLSKRLTRSLAVMDFFRYPTVGALAEFWSGRKPESRRGEDGAEHAEARRSALKRQRQLRQAVGADNYGQTGR